MIKPYDDTKEIAITDDPVTFSTKQFVTIAKEAIKDKGVFTVALSGGSTPKALYNQLQDHKQSIDWSKVLIFFSDERSVGPENPDSNYHMAMTNGISSLNIPSSQIFRMKGEDKIEENAKNYQKLIEKFVPDRSFDLILLGMGDDGHTASLFPGTKALDESKKLVVANHVPQKSTMRMTFTYPLIMQAQHVMFMASGASKATMVADVLANPTKKHPSSIVTCSNNKVLWVLDKGSAGHLN